MQSPLDKDILFVIPYAIEAAPEVDVRLEIFSDNGLVRAEEIHRELMLFREVSLDDVQQALNTLVGTGQLVKEVHETGNYGANGSWNTQLFEVAFYRLP